MNTGGAAFFLFGQPEAKGKTIEQQKV